MLSRRDAEAGAAKPHHTIEGILSSALDQEYVEFTSPSKAQMYNSVRPQLDPNEKKALKSAGSELHWKTVSSHTLYSSD